MSLYELAEGCAQCRVCEGAAYQTPPALFAGFPEAPILGIGQNPGEIKKTDKQRQIWIKILNFLPVEVAGTVMPAWYMWDIYDSPGHARMSKVFGKDWLLKYEMMWTNAVRCRTPGNESPSREMVATCATWTQHLLENRKAIIMVGAVARHQVLGEDAKKLPWGTPKRHPKLGFLLAIKHYSTWESDDIDLYKEAVKRIREKI